MTITGCDVSSYQHPDDKAIDYKTAVSKGIDFAIVEYRDAEAAVNPFFEEDVAGFKAAGVPTGSYIYLRPELPLAPQADDLRMLAKYGPVWGDLEVTGNKSGAELRKWWEDLRSGAPHIGLYSYPAFLEAYGPFASPAPEWIANFGAKSAPAGALVWQMTNNSEVPGIRAPVDLDAFTGTRAQFDTLFGKATSPKAKPTTTIEIVGGASTPSGAGYWLVSSVGDVFNFGDAAYHGSPASPAATPVVAIIASPRGVGYRLVYRGGGVQDFGDARVEASAGSSAVS